MIFIGLSHTSIDKNRRTNARLSLVVVHQYENQQRNFDDLTEHKFAVSCHFNLIKTSSFHIYFLQ